MNKYHSEDIPLPDIDLEHVKQTIHLSKQAYETRTIEKRESNLTTIYHRVMWYYQKHSFAFLSLVVFTLIFAIWLFLLNGELKNALAFMTVSGSIYSALLFYDACYSDLYQTTELETTYPYSPQKFFAFRSFVFTISIMICIAVFSFFCTQKTHISMAPLFYSGCFPFLLFNCLLVVQRSHISKRFGVFLYGVILIVLLLVDTLQPSRFFAWISEYGMVLTVLLLGNHIAQLFYKRRVNV